MKANEGTLVKGTGTREGGTAQCQTNSLSSQCRSRTDEFLPTRRSDASHSQYYTNRIPFLIHATQLFPIRYPITIPDYDTRLLLNDYTYVPYTRKQNQTKPVKTRQHTMPFPPKSELTSCLTSFLSSPSPLSPSSTSLSSLFLKVCETAIESDSNVNKGFHILKDMLGEWKEEKEGERKLSTHTHLRKHTGGE